MTSTHDEYGRRIVTPSADPLTQVIGRTLCALMGLDPDTLVQGVTGAMWVQWDRVALHQGTQLHDALAAAGYVVMPFTYRSNLPDHDGALTGAVLCSTHPTKKDPPIP